jgi:hypothetical protein
MEAGMADHQSNYELRPGVAASATARLCIVATLCGFQYWLLTSTMEAYHAGNFRILLPAFIASVICLALSVGLVVTGEYTLHRAAEEES